MQKMGVKAVHLEKVEQAVRDIWYSYAEGFLPQLTGTAADDVLYQHIDARMPSGWTASIQPSGTVYASRPILVKKSMGVLVFEKTADGQQRMFQIAL
ncbi:hypothetical protein [Alicyclobacillus fodiniaquatilis]|uniref:Uncharacterized protein n=1 Tax=Alicyclobacillus fodiniaquatilis TaxID=1661150 RepID=A0ABW4JIW5_9BACL